MRRCGLEEKFNHRLLLAFRKALRQNPKDVPSENVIFARAWFEIKPEVIAWETEHDAEAITVNRPQPPPKVDPFAHREFIEEPEPEPEPEPVVVEKPKRRRRKKVEPAAVEAEPAPEPAKPRDPNRTLNKSDYAWVLANYATRDGVEPTDAPSLAAWNLLQMADDVGIFRDIMKQATDGGEKADEKDTQALDKTGLADLLRQEFSREFLEQKHADLAHIL